MKHIMLFGVLLFQAQVTWSRPLIYNDDEMVRRATAIAQVEISTGGTNAAPFTLHGVRATLIRNIKGTLPPVFDLSEGNQMECGRPIPAGTYLVFIFEKDGHFWGANCGLSWRQIVNGQIIWPMSFKAGEKRQISVRQALKEIRAEMKK